MAWNASTLRLAKRRTLNRLIFSLAGLRLYLRSSLVCPAFTNLILKLVLTMLNQHPSMARLTDDQWSLRYYNRRRIERWRPRRGKQSNLAFFRTVQKAIMLAFIRQKNHSNLSPVKMNTSLIVFIRSRLAYKTIRSLQCFKTRQI